MTETIAAIATPPGVGGIGVVRISGESAIEVADQVVKLEGRQISSMKGYTCAYGRAVDKDGEIDEVIVTLFRQPHSYTGEDVVEISGHGGTYLLNRIVRACCDNGARSAAAGEFTKRAFLNGKLDLTRAESVIDLIHATGKQSARAALAARDGALFQKMDKVAKDLIGLGAGLAAWIDYPEEDIEETQQKEMAEILQRSAVELENLLDTYEAGKVFREGIETAIVGRPNVGKSTLMNLLTGYERSIVTEIPGTTRDLVSDTVRVGDVVLHLFDTAGIRQTEDRVEQAGVLKTEDTLRKAQLVLAVFDGSQPLDENDRRVVEGCRDTVTIALVNKNDLPQQLDLDALSQDFDRVIQVSAKRGKGLSELYEAISELFRLGNFDPCAAVVANQRQRDGIRRARQSVREAFDALRTGVSFDAIGVCIEEAADALLEVTGQKAAPSIVDEIFSRFCVGK